LFPRKKEGRVRDPLLLPKSYRLGVGRFETGGASRGGGDDGGGDEAGGGDDGTALGASGARVGVGRADCGGGW
jgi:hypothetical protein